MGSDGACLDCDVPGWFWWPTARIWVACATCNDAGDKPKPTWALARRLRREAPLAVVVAGAPAAADPGRAPGGRRRP